MKNQLPRKVLALTTYAALSLVLLPLGSLGSAQADPLGGVARARIIGPAIQYHQTHAVGLGKMLTTADGGQIFGFDIDQFGNNGVLASAQTVSPSGEKLVSMETFDQNTGKITRSFAQYRGKRNSYSVDGIFAGDVGLVTHYIKPKNSPYATRHYDVMNPVGAELFTGKWTPPIEDIDIRLAAENQTTTTSVLFAIELNNLDVPDLIVSNIAANTFGNVIHLDPNLFGLGNGPNLGQYTAANEAVLALSPDGGARNGSAPINVLVNLNTGRVLQFNGFNNGPDGAGYVTGLAVDPNAGIAATATELNAQVEFYDLSKRTGITAVQLPCTGPLSQSNSGAGITVDPLHKLFLVTNPFYCDESGRSALVIYDEAGNLVETITGFKFAIGEPPVAINPAKRMGWAFGPQFSQLQQFFY